MPNDDGGVSAMLAGAKKTLSDVSHSKVDTNGQHAWSGSGAYSAARSARKAAPVKPAESGIVKEAADAGAGIKSRMEMTEAARKSIEQ